MNDWKAEYLKEKKANDVMFAWCETAKKQLVEQGKLIDLQEGIVDIQEDRMDIQNRRINLKDAQIINQQSAIDTKDEIISRMKELANMSHEASKREIFALKCLSACLLTAIVVIL